MIRRVKNSLGLRGVIFFSSWLIVILSFMTIMNVVSQSNILRNREQHSARKIAELIRTAMDYPMVNGDQDVIQKQFDGYKTLEGLHVAHLTDSKGIIRRSTDKSLMGKVTLSPFIDDALHGKEYHGLENRKRSGKLIYAELIPIKNEKRCYPCHGMKETILGVVRVGIDWDPVLQALDSTKKRNIFLSFAGLIVMIFLTIYFVFRIIVSPIRKLELGVKKVSEGDLETIIETESKDEIGNLTGLFNKMTQDLKRLMDTEQERSEELSSMNVSLQTEITERRRAELSMQNSNRRLTEIIDFFPDATMVVDSHGLVIAWNRAMEEMCEIKAGEILGKGDYLYAVPFYGKRRPILVDAAIHPEILLESRYSLLSREGATLIGEAFAPSLHRGTGAYLWVKATPLYDAQGNITGAVESVRDITDRKKAEVDLEKAYNELKQVQARLIQSAKMASIGTLAGGVAHEINNPLTGVLNNVQLIKMLAKEKATFNMADFEELLNVIEESANRCITITRSLLDFSHASKGDFSRISMNDILVKVLTFVEHDMSLENIILEKALEPDLPLVNGDHQLLQQVILDLLSNARWAIHKKSGKNGGKITIKTENAAREKGINVYITDTGIGMDKEHQEKIFEPFFTTKEVGEGTGLGMAITYSIVKVHQGRIEVKSEKGQGSTFMIFLPVAKNGEV
jgi:signal transduction histidine kinase/HAMP domain-containing protein